MTPSALRSLVEKCKGTPDPAEMDALVESLLSRADLLIAAWELAEGADRMDALTKKVQETHSLADAGELSGAIWAYKDALARFRAAREVKP